MVSVSAVIMHSNTRLMSASLYCYCVEIGLGLKIFATSAYSVITASTILERMFRNSGLYSLTENM